MRELLGRFEERVLMLVAETPGICVAEAQAALGCAVGQAHGALRRLEGKGMIIQSGWRDSANGGSGRKPLPYRTTAIGREALSTTAAHNAEMVDRWRQLER